MDPRLIAIPLLAGLGTAVLATPLVSRLARVLGAIDRPNERKVNRREDIPLLGGLAVALGCTVALATTTLFVGDEVLGEHPLEAFLLGGAVLLVVGATDDRWGLSALPKLISQIVVAAIAIYFGFTIPHITEPLTRTTFLLPTWLSWLVTTVWIVGVTNAINLIDGLDGLAAGLGAIIAATLTMICWQSGQIAGVVFGAALVGSLLGFLPFNFPPAKIFLGDTGALFVGYCLAILTLEGYRTTALLTFVVPLLALAVPLLDTGLSIMRRIRERRPVFSADREHMHHRLLESEGSDRGAVVSLYFLTACFCVIAFSFTRLQGYAAIIFLVTVVILTIRLIRNLGNLSPREKPPVAEAEAANEGESK